MSDSHVISINCERGQYMPHDSHRARCSCGWWSDCYSQMSDTQRAIAVHLRRAASKSFEEVLARSSIGQAMADIKTRGIEAHLIDLEREMNRRWSGKKSKRSKAKKLSTKDAAFMRGFGAALASIWRCHHDGQMVRHLITQNNFKLASFRGVGMLDADYKAIKSAVKR